MKIIVQYKTCRHMDCGEGPTRAKVFSAETPLKEVILWERNMQKGSALTRCSDITIIGEEEEGEDASVEIL